MTEDDFPTRKDVELMILEEKMTYSTSKDLLNEFYDEVARTSLNDIIKTGIKEIDDVIIGIFPETLLVIAGETGEGKSLFAGNIAFNAIKQEKRVVYFDLENDTGDFFRRQVARELALKGIKVRHMELKIKEFFEKKQDEISKCVFDIAEKLGNNFFLYNNHKIPTLEEFEHALSLVERTCNLVVIDHLHYFEFERDQSDSENIGRIMRRLRKINKELRIPIILVSHVRKRQSKGSLGNDDLFGSSNIAKEATNVIMLSKDDGGCRIALTKSRGDYIRKSWYYKKGNYSFNNLTEIDKSIYDPEFNM